MVGYVHKNTNSPLIQTAAEVFCKVQNIPQIISSCQIAKCQSSDTFGPITLSQPLTSTDEIDV